MISGRVCIFGEDYGVLPISFIQGRGYSDVVVVERYSIADGHFMDSRNVGIFLSSRSRRGLRSRRVDSEIHSPKTYLSLVSIVNPTLLVPPAMPLSRKCPCHALNQTPFIVLVHRRRTRRDSKYSITTRPARTAVSASQIQSI